MSWSEVFPVLSEEMLEAYEIEVSPQERAQYEAWLGVDQVLNPRKTRHTVCFSLFWKNLHFAEPDLPKPTRAILKKAKELGLVNRMPPWEHYIQPLLDGARKVHKVREDVSFRIYLAADLDFLAQDFIKLGCEVRLMKSASIRHNPGALWRFLALDEVDTLVTFSDSDRAPHVLEDIKRTEAISQSGLGLWRVPWLTEKPVVDNPDAKNAVAYRPILGCQFGACKPFPSRKLMEAVLWNTEHGHLTPECHPPGGGLQRVFGSVWPNYGYDEWFLQTAIYPRAAFEGIVSFLPAGVDSRLVPLDIEFVTWANPNSQIIYFGHHHQHEHSDECCHGDQKAKKPKPLKKPKASPVYREWTASLPPPMKAAAARESLPPTTLVVARYKEDLAWLTKVPKDIKVVVYNKGPELTDKAVLARIDSLLRLKNQGRESDTYLHHLLIAEPGKPDGFTVFVQGEPFAHSPDLIPLLEARHQWSDVQHLSWGWTEGSGIPPQSMMDDERSQWIGNLRVRLQEYGAWNMDMLGFNDHGSRRMMPHYLHHNKLEDGWCIAGHFLERCGLSGLAKEAWAASLGRFAYGAQFAIRNDRLGMIPKEVLPRMKKLAREFYVNGYIFERLWLHFFGLPFVTTHRTRRSIGLRAAK